MTTSTEFWVDRNNLRENRIVQRPLPPLGEGQVRVAIDMFGLTANNVSYAVTGDAIGYWGYYPAEENWGKVPAWGCADVVESRCDDIEVGERLWGFFPMASHVDLLPGKIREDQFVDIVQHRQPLPALYNGYRRTGAEPDILRQMEVERCLLFPLFITSFVLYDRLVDNEFFGAAQVVIGSVSSKTGFGLAQMLHDDTAVKQRIVGVTSPANVDFVNGLGCCDQVVVYGEEEEIDASLPTAYVDMSGDVRLTRALHLHIGANMVESCMVGASHWDQGGDPGELPGARPEFFFAPAQIAKRDMEWGPGVAMARAGEASARVAMKVKNEMSVEWTRDAEALQALWLDLLDNKVSPRKGQMVSLRG